MDVLKFLVKKLEYYALASVSHLLTILGNVWQLLHAGMLITLPKLT